MQRLPEEIVIFHILGCLSRKEIVCGIGETERRMCGLVRSRYGIWLEMFPFEAHPEMGWMKVEKVIWGRRGVKAEEFMGGMNREEAAGYALNNVKCQLEQFQSVDYCLFSQFDLHRCVINQHALSLKNLELQSMKIESSDLLAFQAIKSLESLSLRECYFECDLDVFPPNLKTLQVNNMNRKSKVGVKNIPHSIQSIDAVGFFIPHSKESQFLYPSGLLHMNISDHKFENVLNSCAAAPGNNSFPFNIPSNLKTLRFARVCPEFESFPSLSKLNELDSLELRGCHKLMEIPALPQSLRKLLLIECSTVPSVQFPIYLEELGCFNCWELEIDFSALPPNLKKLKLVPCRKMSETRSISFPLHLQELHLENFINITSFPNIPSCLKSLTLMGFTKLLSLPKFPETLKSLKLEFLESLNNLPSLPTNLELLSLHGCWHVKFLGQVPPNLHTLEFGITDIPSYKNVNLSNTLTKLFIAHASSNNFDLTRFPDHLECLDLERMTGVKSLPQLPETLKALNLIDLKGLECIPLLPGSLQELLVRRCGSICELVKLPSRLRSLIICCCNQIEFIGMEKRSSEKSTGSIGKLPNSLTTFELTNCKKLRTIAELPSNLRNMKIELNGKFLFHCTMPHRLENVCFDD